VLHASPSGVGITYLWYNGTNAISGATNVTYSVTTNGNYNVVVTSGSCTATSNTITITQNPLPQATAAPTGPLELCAGIAVALSANTGPGLSYQWYKGKGPIANAVSNTYTASGNASSAFKVVVTNSFGCSATSNAVVVNRLATPAATIAVTNPPNNPNLCVNGQVKLRANGSSSVPLAYQWYRNNVVIALATTKDFTATTTGSYRVKVANQNTACNKTSAAIVVINSCKTKETFATYPQLAIYPNPTDRDFMIALKLADGLNGSAMLQIFNALGQNVRSETVPVAEGELLEEINFGDNEAGGIYFIRVMVNDQIFKGQVIYEK
jgi:hypothetical protein